MQARTISMLSTFYSPLTSHPPTVCHQNKVDGAHEIYKRMAGKGVVVRYRGNELHCKDCLRITVGTPEENNRLLELLQETVAEILAAS